MEFTIKVEIGVTPALAGILQAMTGASSQLKQSAEVVAPLEEEPKAPSKKKPEPKEVTDETEDKGKAKAKEESVAEPVTVKTPEEPVGKATYTEEDVRDAMHRCRVRIEGSSYKEDTTTPGYQKFHRALTARFKEMAQLIGFDKPSALPAEHRKRFIDMCADTIVGDNGELTALIPF